jgi:hypothetical protein
MLRGNARQCGIEGRVLQSEDNRSVTWSGLQTEVGERTPWRSTNVEPSTQHGIAAIRLNVFTLPNSPLDAYQCSELNDG